MPANKIKTRAELAELVREKKSSGKIVGFTNGCFDILHLGHVRYLIEAKQKCDILVVGVNDDASVGRLKGRSRPFNNQQARIEVLAALECVDFLTFFTEDTPEALIQTLTPDILFKGGDWKIKDIAGAGHVTERGGKVEVMPYVGGYSTTNLVKRIKED